MSQDHPTASPPQFRVSTLMLLIAVVGVDLWFLLAVWKAAQGIAVVVAVPVTVATIAALREAARQSRRPRNAMDVVAAYIAGFVLTSLLIMVTSITFFFTCSAVLVTVGQFSNAGLAIGAGLLVGGIAAIAALAVMTRAITGRNRTISAEDQWAGRGE